MAARRNLNKERPVKKVDAPALAIAPKLGTPEGFDADVVRLQGQAAEYERQIGEHQAAINELQKQLLITEGFARAALYYKAQFAPPVEPPAPPTGGIGEGQSNASSG